MAQESQPVLPPRTGPAFAVEANADAWFARLVGDVTSAAGVERDVRDLDLRDSEVAFAGSLRFQWERGFAEVGGLSFATDGAYTDGADAFESDFRWWGASVDLGYAFWTPFSDSVWPWTGGAFGEASHDRYGGNVNSNGDYRVELRVSPTIGMTYHDIELNDINITQATQDGLDGGWLALRGGAEMQLWLRPGADFSFLKAIVIEAALSAGGVFGLTGEASGTGIGFELDAGVRLYFHENIGARLGYRLNRAEFDGEAGSSDLDLGAYGLFAGITLRF
jgi:opacity protein-like surface antigen